MNYIEGNRVVYLQVIISSSMENGDADEIEFYVVVFLFLIRKRWSISYLFLYERRRHTITLLC